MSGSAFPALLQLECSINTLVGCIVTSSQVVSGANLYQIGVLPGSSRYLPAQMRKLGGFWSKSWGFFFVFIRSVWEYQWGGFQSWVMVVSRWQLSDNSWVAGIIWKCLCSNLSKQQSAMQSGIVLSGFCLLRQTVCNQSDSHAPLQNFWGGRTKSGDWGCHKYLFTVNLQLTSVIKANSSSSLLQTDEYLALSILA